MSVIGCHDVAYVAFPWLFVKIRKKDELDKVKMNKKM